MATFAIHMMDSVKGMVSSSFTISDADMQRVLKALNYIYTNEITKDSSMAYGQRDVFDAVFKKKDLDNKQICKVLGANIVNGLINSVRNVENEIFAKELEEKHVPVRITEEGR